MRRTYALILAALATACAKPETMEQANARMASEAATARAAIEQWDPLESTCRHASLSIL